MTRVPTCRTCGHPIPRDDVAAALVGKQRKLYEAVADAGTRGINSLQIMSELYGDDPGGGPESANVVSVMNGHVNRHLEPFWSSH